MYLICIPGVRAAAHRSWRARRECQLEICHRRGADQHQGAVQQHQGARAADWAEEQRACEEQGQQLKLSKLQNRDPAGGGGLPMHHLLPHLLHWGARWDGDLGVLKLKDSRGFLAVNFWIFGGKPKFSSNVTIDNLLLVVDANAESLLNTKVNILNNIS